MSFINCKESGNRVRRFGFNMKYGCMVIATLAVLAGCNGKQNSIVTAHNKMVAAEQQYLKEYSAAIENNDFEGCHAATAGYLKAVQNIDMSGCPDDYQQAMNGLENSLSEISGYFSGANSFENIGDKFGTLQDARLDATVNLNEVAKGHGVGILEPPTGAKQPDNTLSNLIVTAHNKMVAAETNYVTEYDAAVENGDFAGCHAATNKYFEAVQNINMNGCPDDYQQAMNGLENSLSEISGYFSGANNIENVDQETLKALQDARLDATMKLNDVANGHGLIIIND